MKFKIINILGLVGLAATTLLSGCDQVGGGSYETTDSGLQYMYVEEGEGANPQLGEIMLINMTYSTENDSLLFSTEEQGGPVPIKIDSSAQGQIYEGFSMLKEGDSVVFKIGAEEVFVNTFNAPIPDFIDSLSNIIFNVGVDRVMNEEDFQAYRMEMMRKQQEDMLAQQSEQMEIDSAKIEQYLEENNIDAQATESGLRYVINEKGTGVQPSAGDSVYVHYSGKLLDGPYFDTSIESLAKEEGLYNEQRDYEPLVFPIGQQFVIPGWDEGISLLNEGAKATFYIPSPLGYGPRGNGSVIPENSILVFDVELVDVKQVSN
ncbi:FKBP-type peptidyl-prolyl cis-trans isomerase FkpA [Catalinimonas alkaloidigena]|uniref:FKBP-type peptidyl-prolyl cis-trans isomerase n=1 Tax=Catalinimonas alkaloidigena TaxID=1075417 RepID=UPI002406A61C|nr:FKBP-type peptidyl-prolyl cis-trans isomerase [Catalinimonas alkaloidigena]MDF9800206.1 FKBP-type peptidyl-prolyl cis-trans isomerase FkpA [Catalinimonas alkaloidigena]